MGGLLRTTLLIVVVVKVLAMNIFYHVRLEATHLSDTMRSAILLLLCLVRYAMELQLSPIYNNCLERRWSIVQLRGSRTTSYIDVAVYGFWGGRFEKAFFDVRVLNPSPSSNQQGSLQSIYRRHEQEKKREI